MKRLFIETKAFKDKLDNLDQPFLLGKIQSEILKNPKNGRLIRGTGGVRKMRIPDLTKNRGKRGDFRVIYFDLENYEKTFLIWIYEKKECDDISPDEKKQIFKLTKLLIKENKP